MYFFTHRHIKLEPNVQALVVLSVSACSQILQARAIPLNKRLNICLIVSFIIDLFQHVSRQKLKKDKKQEMKLIKRKLS